MADRCIGFKLLLGRFTLLLEIMATWGYLGLQDRASPLIEQLIFFHDHAIVVLILITTLVGYIMATLFSNTFTNRFLLEGQTIEIIWTVLPALILIFIALPSLRTTLLIGWSEQP